MSKAGTWLRGSIVRKSGIPNPSSSSQSTRPSTPAQNVVSTATLSFGGGVKDPTGKVSEYHVRPDLMSMRQSTLFTIISIPFYLGGYVYMAVNGRPMSGLQVRSLLKSQASTACQCLLPQNVFNIAII